MNASPVHPRPAPARPSFPRRRLLRSALALPLAGGLLVACDGDDTAPGTTSDAGGAAQDPDAVQRSTETAGVMAADANAVSAATFTSSPVAVVAASEDAAVLAPAASAAIALGVPLLIGDATSVAEPLNALGANAALTFGQLELDGVDMVRGGGDVEALSNATGHDFTERHPVAAEDLATEIAGLEAGGGVLLTIGEDPVPGEDLDGKRKLPDFEAASGDSAPLALTATGAEVPVGALAAAKAAGATMTELPHADPRFSSDSVQAVTAATGPVLALSPEFGDQFPARVEMARTVPEVPGGGQLVIPGKRIIALYGHPGSPVLGVMGEQGPQESVARAEEHAAPYRDLTEDTVVPSFEIIATVASSTAGRDGRYSNVSTIDHLRPYVDAARENGMFAILDLQPGRTHFLEQAKIYEELLKEPHVGLALDPEWRLKPDQVHLKQIGSVEAAEVNEVSAWLAELTRTNNLPQKILVLHQFRYSMIRNRQDLDTSHDELAMILHADGQGGQGAKTATWEALKKDLPEGIHMAWKNFYDEDIPMLDAKQTFQVEPTPVMVSYQ
ncbi:hypothetical protein M3F57_13285 [Brachybacterium muris]|uniref:hypothetical protein n=1 Tax=Brachybacterium muris TaxID=219301 RepID=UPI00223B14D9|nr:hypothetical protein [Brachybacterium muris]